LNPTLAATGNLPTQHEQKLARIKNKAKSILIGESIKDKPAIT
jgi:hypothetical protein